MGQVSNWLAMADQWKVIVEAGFGHWEVRAGASGSRLGEDALIMLEEKGPPGR